MPTRTGRGASGWPACRAAVVIAAVAAGAAGAVGQQFRSGTELVLVDVVAVRADGSLARDLSAGDFEIFEDGRPQPIRQFQVVDLEHAAERNPDPPGVFSNAAEPGAIFALVIDDLMMHPRETPAMRQWARRFLDEHVRSQDYVGVVRSAGDSPLVFTTDRELVAATISEVFGRGGEGAITGLTGSRDDVVPMPGGEPLTLADFSALDPLDPGAAAVQAERSLVALRSVVEALAPIPGRRKAVLLFGPGIPFDVEALASQRTSRTLDSMRRLLAAAREGNVAIYTIDPRGARGSQEPAIGAEPEPATPDTALDALRDLATATGGRAVVSTNRLAEALDRIAAENRFYYLLGYEPASSGGVRARRIEVRTRAAGVRLLHRRVYAPGASASGADRTASALPRAGLPIVLAPALFPDPAGGASVAVPFELGEGLRDGTAVGYSLVAVDARGRQAAGVRGSVQAVGGTAVGLTRLTVPPGRYQVRLAAETEGGGQDGVALANVHVPAPGAEPPVCAGFLFAQHDGRRVRPVASRRFHPEQSVMVSAVVSGGPSVARTALEFAVTAPGSDTTLVFEGPRPQPIAPGLWRLEITLPPPLPSGALALGILADQIPLAGCRAELVVR